MTTITVVGNCTREPELRYLASGQALTKFAIAANTYRGTGDDRKETVSFFDITAFGELAEHCQDSLAKGMRVVVTGRLEQRMWETDAGEKRTAWGVTADEVAPSLRWATAKVTKAEKVEQSRTSRPSQPTDDELEMPF